MLNDLIKFKEQLENNPSYYGVINRNFKYEISDDSIKFNDFDDEESLYEFTSNMEEEFKKTIERFNKINFSFDKLEIFTKIGVCCTERIAKSFVLGEKRMIENDRFKSEVKKSISKKYIYVDFRMNPDTCILSDEELMENGQKMSLTSFINKYGSDALEKEKNYKELSYYEGKYLILSKSTCNHTYSLGEAYIPFDLFISRMKEYGYDIILDDGTNIVECTNIEQYINAFMDTFNKNIELRIVANLNKKIDENNLVAVFKSKEDEELFSKISNERIDTNSKLSWNSDESPKVYNKVK